MQEGIYGKKTDCSFREFLLSLKDLRQNNLRGIGQNRRPKYATSPCQNTVRLAGKLSAGKKNPIVLVSRVKSYSVTRIVEIPRGMI